jgi:hypothetical protein
MSDIVFNIPAVEAFVRSPAEKSGSSVLRGRT